MLMSSGRERIIGNSVIYNDGIQWIVQRLTDTINKKGEPVVARGSKSYFAKLSTVAERVASHKLMALWDDELTSTESLLEGI